METRPGQLVKRRNPTFKGGNNLENGGFKSPFSIILGSFQPSFPLQGYKDDLKGR